MTKTPSVAPDHVAALLPLKPHAYHILFVLLEGECHGYRMVKEIAHKTRGQIRMDAGNLYRFIRRLIQDGLVVESDRRPAPESDDERRRYYRITDLGKRIFVAETDRLRSMVTAAEARVREVEA